MQSSFPRRLLRSPYLYVALGLGVLGLIAGLFIANWLYNHDDRVRFRVQEYWSSFQDFIDPQAEFAPTAAVQQAALPTLPPSATATPTSNRCPTRIGDRTASTATTRGRWSPTSWGREASSRI